MQRNARKNRRLFYILLIVSLVIALFISVIIGLIVLVANVVYFFYRGKSPSKSDYAALNEMPNESQESALQRDTVKIPCKYCKALVDPVQDKVCPNCGAPIDLT
ncbi:MAG: hypothetical protein ABSE82_00170 [Nitrososphaerales archaeon]